MCMITRHAENSVYRHPLLSVMAKIDDIKESIDRLRKYTFDNRSYAICIKDCGKIFVNSDQDERGRYIVMVVRDNRLISVFPTQRMDKKHLRVDVIIQ